MFFMSRSNAAAPKASRNIAERRSPRRRTPLRLETLEGRDLMTTIPGVSVMWGTIAIQGTYSGGNSAHVSMDENIVRVTLNGQVAEFNASEVYSVSYHGGASGGDTFVNDTNLSAMMTGFGGNNNFRGGSNFSTVYFFGNHNSYDSQGGGSYVFSYDGPNNVIEQYSNDYLYSYDTSAFFAYY